MTDAHAGPSDASLPVPDLVFGTYTHEDQLSVIHDMVSEDLSEPYTIFTFRYFVHEFQELCIFAYVDQKPIGVVVCRQDVRVDGTNRGYIGMLAVKKPFRHMGIATQLAKKAIQKMQEQGAQEIVLETEVDNQAALAFYSRLNFMRYKRLHAFYLNRKDAFRLLLPLPPRSPSPAQDLNSSTT